MPLLEVAHEPRQCGDTGLGHRVVDRSTHAAERAMSLQRNQPGGLRLGEESLVECSVMQEERYVHARTHRRIDFIAVETAGAVDRRVQQRRLARIAPGEFSDATF